MAFYDDSFIDQIRESINIVDVISGHVTLKPAGSGRYKGLCPFHTEKTPSFTVQPDRGMYHCFGCGKGGTIFNFLMETEGISFPEAIRTLADRAGIDLPQQVNTEASKKIRSEKDNIFNANQFAQSWFHKQLITSKSAEAIKAKQYLADRGIDDNIINRYSIGWAETGWDNLVKAAASNKISGVNLHQAGLANRRKDGSGYLDRFRGRVMFPILNLSGKPIAFGGRRIEGITPDDDIAKYVNSPETSIYHKGDNLYGLFTSRDAIRKSGVAYLVEGYTDLLALIQAGVDNVVASLGTALTPHQVALIKRFAPVVHIVYDSDTAGITAAIRAADMLTVSEMEARIVKLPKGDDPDTFLRKSGAKELCKVLANTLSFIQYRLDTANITSSSGQSERVTVARELLQTIRSVNDPMQAELLRNELSQLIGISQLALDRELATKPIRRNSNEAIVKEKITVPSDSIAERDLIQALLAQPDLMDVTIEEITLRDIKHPPLQNIYRILEQAYLHDETLDLSQLPDKFDDPMIRAFITEAVLSPEWVTQEKAEQVVKDCLKVINLRKLQLRKTEIEAKMNRNSKPGQMPIELKQELGDLIRELRAIEANGK